MARTDGIQLRQATTFDSDKNFQKLLGSLERLVPQLDSKVWTVWTYAILGDGTYGTYVETVEI